MENREFKKRELFGGAITVDLPSDVIDVADMRQVPDEQEVFVFPNSDLSVVVTCNERVPPTDSDEAIRYHFDAIASDNEALEKQIEKVDVNEYPQPILCSGLQKVSKFNLGPSFADELELHLALWRIPNKAVDLILSINAPRKKVAYPEEGQQVFKRAAETLVVQDMKLFP